MQQGRIKRGMKEREGENTVGKKVLNEGKE